MGCFDFFLVGMSTHPGSALRSFLHAIAAMIVQKPRFWTDILTSWKILWSISEIQKDKKYKKLVLIFLKNYKELV